MAGSVTRTGGTGLRGSIGKDRIGRATISGHVLKLVRESIHLTQQTLAERLDVEINTVQGWESGRRPLTATSVATLMRVRQRLRSLGASAEMLDALSDAVDADCFLAYVFETETASVQPDDHPLATWVMKRSFHGMIAWPVLGHRPLALLPADVAPRRRGPVPDVPILSNSERSHLFENLRVAVEKSHAGGGAPIESEQSQLLRRQAYFLASLDRSSDAQDWLQQMAAREDRRLPNLGSWSPGWVTARSMSVARARVGDPEPLRWFIDHGCLSDEERRADLNYWAYWLGQIPESYHGDAFMVDDGVSWHGVPLLSRLCKILPLTRTTADIYIHSIWALVDGRPEVLHQDPSLAARLHRSVVELLDRDAICPQSRGKLESLNYGLKLVRRDLKSRLPEGVRDV